MSQQHSPTPREESLAVTTLGFVVLNVPRVILGIALLAGVFIMAAYATGVVRQSFDEALHMFSGSAGTVESLIGTLEIVDALLILGVMYLTIHGTYSIYVAPDKGEDEPNVPSALKGIDSGKLKEKLSSSLITASAVYLFKIAMQLTESTGDLSSRINWHDFSIFGTIHLLFIVGYAVIAHSNRHNPHKVSGHAPASTEHTPKGPSDPTGDTEGDSSEPTPTH